MPTSSDQGFTLLEMLVVICVASMMFSAFYLTFSLLGNSSRRAAESSSRIEQVVDLKNLMDELLSQVDLVDGGVSGDASGVQVASMGPRSLAFAKPTRFSFKKGDDGFGLTMSWVNRDGITFVSKQIVSSDHIVEFAYFSKGRRWTSDWERGVEQPSLLSVSVRDRFRGHSNYFILRLKFLVATICAFEGGEACVRR